MALIVAYGHFFGQTKLFMLAHYKDAIPSSMLSFYKLTETTPFIFTINGNFATTVFFILSGCVLLNAFKANQTFIGAFVRRFMRLGLPVFISCLIGFVMIRYGFRDDYTNAVSFNEVIKQGILTLYSSDFYTRFLNPVIWSMPTEFIGSILLLIIAHVGRRSNSNALFLLFLMTVFSYGYYVFFMLIGAWLSIIFANPDIKDLMNKKNVAYSIVALSLVILLQSCPTFHPWGRLFIPDNFFVEPLINLQSYSIAGMYPYHSYEFLRGVGGVLLLIVIMSQSCMREILSSRFVQFFGKISFSLYLVHWLVLSSIIMPLNIYMFNSTASVYLSVLSSFFVFAVVTIFLSLLFYSVIELRAINLSRSVGKSIDSLLVRLKV